MPLACADRPRYGKGSPRNFIRSETRASCRSSVVEHSLGKGEVVSSILTGSTSFLAFSKTHRAPAFLSSARAQPSHIS